ncbi:TPA: glycosyltransferase [Streptococcus agalactiae]|nr:glycosyltransferase [Streptococcus agalactiae]
MKKTIVLGADFQYRDQVMTTIKSIVSHNQHLTIYIINTDFPVEWFNILNHSLEQFDCRVKNIPISSDVFEGIPTLSHISVAGFFRWFIPIHLEEEIVLYFDSDVIVRGSLDPLFDINLEENLLGAVADHFSTLYYGDTAPVSFNSGVMLINNSLWKKEEIYNSLMRIADKGSAVGVGDQEYLNILTQNRWIDIGKQYNVQIGQDVNINAYGRPDLYHFYDDCEPVIVHYNSQDKPWNKYSQSRYRSEWWYYFGLEWSVIYAQQQKNLNRLTGKTLNLFTLTASDTLEHIEVLAKALPDYQFHIAARSDISEKLANLETYSNIKVYKLVINPILEELIRNCDVYLDINHSYEVEGILDKIKEENKPILAFDSTAHTTKNIEVISETMPELMVKRIREVGPLR